MLIILCEGLSGVSAGEGKYLFQCRERKKEREKARCFFYLMTKVRRSISDISHERKMNQPFCLSDEYFFIEGYKLWLLLTLTLCR